MPEYTNNPLAPGRTSGSAAASKPFSGDALPIADEACRGQRRPHAAEARLALRHRVDVVIRDADRAPHEPREHLDVARGRRCPHLAPHRARGELARYLATLDTAHAVAHDHDCLLYTSDAADD